MEEQKGKPVPDGEKKPTEPRGPLELSALVLDGMPVFSHSSAHHD